MIWKNLVHLLLLISISVCSARHKRHHRHHHKRHRHPRAEETELEFDTGVGRRNGLLGRDHPEILGVPADPSDLPEAEPLLPGHTLLRPTLGMLRSAMTYPHVDKDNNVYGNAANLGITQTGGRIKYSSFRKNNDVLQTLVDWVKNIQRSIGDDQPAILFLVNKEDAQNTRDDIISSSSAEGNVEKFSDEDTTNGSPRSRLAKALLNLRRSVKHRIRDKSKEQKRSDDSTEQSSDDEKNSGNPYTIHKNRYYQNWMWNHFMDGDHMNINPFGPKFNDLSPSGLDLLYRRKWWYFNQDDYLPVR